MTHKEKFDCCVKLAELSQQRHNNRQAYEWKVSLSLWAAILVSATVLENIKLALWVPFVIPSLYAMFWLRGLWVSNEYDKLRHKHYRKQASKLLIDPEHNIIQFSDNLKGCKKHLGFISDWAMQFHFLATLCLCLLVWAYVNGKLV
jgi:hypothetical protein